MKNTFLTTALVFALIVPLLSGEGVKPGAAVSTVKLPLDSTAGIEAANGQVKVVSYRGRRAVQLVPLAGKEASDDSMMGILTGTDFKNGVIELEVAGAPRKDAAPNMRGFIGVAFRINSSKFEMLYLRPSNARVDDQLQRNHTVQYVCEPDFGWQRLRKENPGVYESYADMEPGAWTKMKIVVSGTKARLYVNGAQEPCLVVNDLKLGEGHGQIALWAHSTTEGYFSNLTVRPEP